MAVEQQEHLAGQKGEAGESGPLSRVKALLSRGLRSLVPHEQRADGTAVPANSPDFALDSASMSAPPFKRELLDAIGQHPRLQGIRPEERLELERQVVTKLLSDETASLRIFSPAYDVFTIVSVDQHGNDSPNAVSYTWKDAAKMQDQLDVAVHESVSFGFNSIHVHDRPLEQNVRYVLKEIARINSHITAGDQFVAYAADNGLEYHIRSGPTAVELNLDSDYPYGHHTIRVGGNALSIAIAPPPKQQGSRMAISQSSVNLYNGVMDFGTSDPSTVGTATLLLRELYSKAQSLPKGEGGVY